MNAKERRRLRRAEAMPRVIPRGLVTSQIEGNGKDRRKAKRAAERMTKDEENHKDQGNAKGQGKRAAERRNEDQGNAKGQGKRAAERMAPRRGMEEKRWPFVAFVGQLAYTTTAEGLRSFFKAKGLSVKVRLLTENGRSKGMAFVECETSEDLDKCVGLHHTQCDGRRLNVERSAGGGKAKKKLKVADGRAKQKNLVEKTVANILDDYITKGRIRSEDIDDGVRHLLARRSPRIAQQALDEFSAIDDRHRLDNPPAYLTNIVTRLTDEDDHLPASSSRKVPSLAKNRSSQDISVHEHSPEPPQKKKTRHREDKDDEIPAAPPTKKNKVVIPDSTSGATMTNDHDLAEIFPALRKAKNQKER